jgi:hypothetical protein
MKLSKFLFLISFSTFFALLYVYQQSEIFRLAYAGQKKANQFQDLLDKNTLLRYNIESSASLINISSKLSKGNDYEMPGTYQLVRLSAPLKNLKPNERIPKKENIIARIFSIKTEAQAKTINP